MLQFLGRDLAVDLGTANTRVYARRRGVVLSEPSVIAISAKTGAVVAVGGEAKRIIGRSSGHVVPIRPLRDGAITDFDATEKMLRCFIHHVRKQPIRSLRRPRVVVCAPSGTSGVQHRALEEVSLGAGARRTCVIEEAIAAAIGVGLPVHEPIGCMIVDIGGGTTDVAVMALGGIVTSSSIQIGGDELDRAIIGYVKRKHSVLLGEDTAEQIKIAIGSVAPRSPEPSAEVRGRDLVTGLPRALKISGDEVRQAMEEPVRAITRTVKQTLDRAPSDLMVDVADRGIVLTGGGALLPGLVDVIGEATGIPVHVAENPLVAVAVGAGKCLDEFPALKEVLF